MKHTPYHQAIQAIQKLAREFSEIRSEVDVLPETL